MIVYHGYIVICKRVLALNTNTLVKQEMSFKKDWSED